MDRFASSRSTGPRRSTARPWSLHQSLARVSTDVAADADTRSVILTGSGTTFSAGGGFSYMQDNIDNAEMRKQTMLEARAIVPGIVPASDSGHRRG